MSEVIKIRKKTVQIDFENTTITIDTARVKKVLSLPLIVLITGVTMLSISLGISLFTEWFRLALLKELAVIYLAVFIVTGIALSFKIAEKWFKLMINLLVNAVTSFTM